MNLVKRPHFPGWAWIPGTYFAEGLPFAVATSVSIVIFKTLGMSNTGMAFWTSLIALPWSIKFLWAPLIDSFRTKREWMLAMQLALAGAFLCLAFSFRESMTPAPVIFCFFLTAFLSATHDVAADGCYMIALDTHEQAFYSGFRNIFYKCAMIVGQGGLVLLAGFLSEKGLSVYASWRYSIFMVSGIMLVLFLWHFRTVPETEKQVAAHDETSENKISFKELITSFFMREGAVYGFLFLLFYRFAEAQLGKLSVPFMLDPVHKGGLGMSIIEQGQYYGVAGTIAFLLGGLLAGAAVSRWGFGKCLWWMVAALNVPDFLYILLAWIRPSAASISGCAIALEQFGYGLGYMAHVLFMVQFAEKSGRYKTSHFAFMTGITILGMTLIGACSGKLQSFFAETLPGLLKGSCDLPAFITESGYFLFFCWIGIATIPSFISAALVKPYIDPMFGKKKE